MFKLALFNVILLVAAAQARDLQQDADAETKRDSKVSLGWSCRRTQFPPKLGCNYE